MLAFGMEFVCENLDKFIHKETESGIEIYDYIGLEENVVIPDNIYMERRLLVFHLKEIKRFFLQIY